MSETLRWHTYARFIIPGYLLLVALIGWVIGYLLGRFGVPK